MGMTMVLSSAIAMIRMLRLSRGIVWGDSLLTQLPTQDVTSTPTRGETIAHDEDNTTMTDECAMNPPAGKDGYDAAKLPHYITKTFLRNIIVSTWIKRL